MSGPDRDGAPGGPGDLLAEYLEQLGAGLRMPRAEAELILAEAEDHLLQTTEAGIAIGMTEREAQEAAISSFGSVQAVSRAHLTRLRQGTGPIDVIMAVWKLIALLLLIGGAGAMAGVALAPPRQIQPGFNYVLTRTYGMGHNAAAASFAMIPGHLTFNWISGTWTEVGIWWTQASSSRHYPCYLVWTAQFGPAWRTLTLVTAAGATLLAGYFLARRGLRHRGAPLAGLFPVVAVGFFGTVALALLGLRLTGQAPAYEPLFAIAALGALLVGYAARMGRTLLRQR
jgi:hypothetical protein